MHVRLLHPQAPVTVGLDCRYSLNTASLYSLLLPVCLLLQLSQDVDSGWMMRWSSGFATWMQIPLNGCSPHDVRSFRTQHTGSILLTPLAILISIHYLC